MKENNNYENQTTSKKNGLLFIIIGLIIGIVGTLSVGYFLEEDLADEEVIDPIEETTDEETDTQNSFDDLNQLAVIDRLYVILMSQYFEELDSDVLIEGALEGMAQAVGDPYTEYLDEVESSSFEEDISGSFQGIGAEVMKDGEYVRIISPIANSPAESAGLQPNDLIVEVDGESVADLTINEAVTLIRGPEGSDVELLMLRGEDQFNITLTRAEIPVETVFYEVDETDTTIGYVSIVNFNTPTYEETVTAIKDLQDQGVTKIVFDIRGNPGGLLTSALQISNIFIPNGEPLMMTEYRQDNEPTVYPASDEYGAFKYDGEAVLLVNEGSASASEILAGAMRSVGIPIYGNTTFGKGTVQSLVALRAEDELKFTSGKWLTAEGDWINEEGIEPDTVVDLPEYAKLFVINTSSTFEPGQASAEVSNLKSVLDALGYSVSDSDVFDDTVVSAIQAFQVDEDLVVNGEVDADTARALTDSLRTQIEENDTQLEAAIESLK